jgi:cytochrome d ubiquinol oxidase subunit II
LALLWFWIVAAMLAAYVIFDGFDLGVGVLYLFVARTPEERRQALSSIGPVWDGNEVWLIAAGGTLFFAFPLLYASSFSGFYLPLMIVLWLLILRGLSLELGSHSTEILWRQFCYGVFAFASTLLIIFYGAALANVVRGVPLGADRYFFLPLWTNGRTGATPGILDWYTVLGGVLALAALSLHGALYLAVKTQGEIERRALRAARWLWPAVVVLTCIGVPATVLARPQSLANYTAHPIDFVFPVLVIAALLTTRFTLNRGSHRTAFLGSCGYLFAMLAGAAGGVYPTLLPSTTPGIPDMTVTEALAGPHTLHVGLAWWTLGIALALTYFVVVYRMFRGKVPLDTESYGH